MATIYVKSTGSNTSPYDTWAKAAPSFATAVSAASAGDTIYFYAETHTLSADAAYAFAGTQAAPVKVICVSDTNEPPTTLATTGVLDGSGTASVDIVVNGVAYIYGISFISGGGTNLGVVSFVQTDDDYIVLDSCKVIISNNNSGSDIRFGFAVISNTAIETRNCTFKFGSTSQSFLLGSSWVSVNDAIDATGSAPSTLIDSTGRGQSLRMDGADLSHITGTLFLRAANNFGLCFISNSKIGAGVTIMASSQIGTGEVILINCSDGDEHYNFWHTNGVGETKVSTGVYVADGSEYNATGAKYSWSITTGPDCSYHQPYVSPWIHTHNETLSAITPYLECMRNNSSGAVFQNDEVWAEISYQGTSGFPISTVVDDKKALFASAVDQTTSSKTATDWTGETGTPGFFKIGPASSITPAEIGPLSARVVVGEPSITVYVDPQIRT